MLAELMDLTTGAGAALMPLLLLAMPGILLCVVIPAVLLLALALPLAVLAAPPYLVARLLRRRRQRATPASVSSEDMTQPAHIVRPRAAQSWWASR